MNRGPIAPVQGFAAQSMALYAAGMGGGAASNGTVAGNGQLDTSNGLYPKATNFLSALTYNAATGKYKVVLTEAAKHILWADGIVVDSGASPTAALEVCVTAIDSVNKTIYVNIYAPNGTLTDLGTSDMLIMKVDIADTTSIG